MSRKGTFSDYKKYSKCTTPLLKSSDSVVCNKCGIPIKKNNMCVVPQTGIFGTVKPIKICRACDRCP